MCHKRQTSKLYAVAVDKWCQTMILKTFEDRLTSTSGLFEAQQETFVVHFNFFYKTEANNLQNTGWTPRKNYLRCKGIRPKPFKAFANGRVVNWLVSRVHQQPVHYCVAYGVAKHETNEPESTLASGVIFLQVLKANYFTKRLYKPSQHAMYTEFVVAALGGSFSQIWVLWLVEIMPYISTDWFSDRVRASEVQSSIDWAWVPAVSRRSFGKRLLR